MISDWCHCCANSRILFCSHIHFVIYFSPPFQVVVEDVISLMTTNLEKFEVERRESNLISNNLEVIKDFWLELKGAVD